MSTPKVKPNHGMVIAIQGDRAVIIRGNVPIKHIPVRATRVPVFRYKKSRFGYMAG